MESGQDWPFAIPTDHQDSPTTHRGYLRQPEPEVWLLWAVGLAMIAGSLRFARGAQTR